MNAKHLGLVLGSAAAAIVALGLVRGNEVSAKGTASSGCAQWEVKIAESASVEAKLPEYSKDPVIKVPAGWEPFAFAPSGQLVYRRCTS